MDTIERAESYFMLLQWSRERCISQFYIDLISSVGLSQFRTQHPSLPSTTISSSGNGSFSSLLSQSELRLKDDHIANVFLSRLFTDTGTVRTQRRSPSLSLTWVIGSFITRTSVTFPNWPKYSLSLSWLVCQESPPTNSFPGAESELGVLRPLESPCEPWEMSPANWSMDNLKQRDISHDVLRISVKCLEDIIVMQRN